MVLATSDGPFDDFDEPEAKAIFIADDDVVEDEEDDDDEDLDFYYRSLILLMNHLILWVLVDMPFLQRQQYHLAIEWLYLLIFPIV